MMFLAATIAPPLARAACPSWMSDPSVPACPGGDNTILSDNYPAMAHVVSDLPLVNSGAGQEFTAEFVENVLVGSGDRVPLMILPVSQSTYEYVRSKVDELGRNPKYSAYRARWLASLVHAPAASSYTWQQDYFESFIDPSTGLPKLREIRDYGRAGDSFDHVSAAASSGCGSISAGPTLPPPSEKQYRFDNGKMGGNIEGLPGGLCLHGDNQDWEHFAKYYCGSRKNEVVIPTSWLNVGHADEVVSTIHSNKAPAPCDFAITVASPQAAIGLLMTSPREKFGAFYSRTGQDLSHRFNSAGMKYLCSLYKQYRDTIRPGLPALPPEEAGGASHASWILRFIDSWDSWDFWEQAWVQRAEASIADECASLTNEEVARLTQLSPAMRISNDLIQMKMEKAKKTIRAKLKERLPQCDPAIIDVPDIFFSKADPIEIKGAPAKGPLDSRYKLPSGVFDSLMPNPTNSITVGATVVTPHPQNAVFGRYMARVYGMHGATYAPVDSYDYAHVGLGNAHCSSHSIRFCRPNGGGSP